MSIGVRDPNGFRPLCLGKLETGWVIASESPALDIVGAHFVREIDPGEMVVIDAGGIRSLHPFPPERISPKLCLVEFVYFARPDAQLYGREVHGARRRMGELLAEQSPVDADMVMGVPESGVPAAEGYAKRSGIPFGQGLVKNRYIGRTFIAPDQASARRRRAPQVQPAARQRPGQAPRSSSTTRSCAAPRTKPSCGCCAKPAPPRCTFGSCCRRGSGRASTASTPAPRPSCSPRT